MFDGAKGIGTCDETAGQFSLAVECNVSVSEFLWITGLLAVLAFLASMLLNVVLAIFLDRRDNIFCRFLGRLVSSEEAQVDDESFDLKDFRLLSCHQKSLHYFRVSPKQGTNQR